MFGSPDTKDAACSVSDLRDALAFIARHAGQLLEIDTPVDPEGELAGVYKLIGAGPPLPPPAPTGPAVLFRNVKGYAWPVLAGLAASRRRTALLLGSSIQRLPFDLAQAFEKPVPPVVVPGGQAPCRQVVIKPPFDLRKLLPAPTHTGADAGPCLTLGVLRAEDAETGQSSLSIHRLFLQGPDRLSCFLAPGRRLEHFRLRAEQAGRPLPVSINLGLDPAVHISAGFGHSAIPAGMDKLALAGAIRRRPVELVDCVSAPAKSIARAEIVLEGEFLPGVRTREDFPLATGIAMPESPGYYGPAYNEVPVIRVTAVTHRQDPVFQTIIGPGEEHTNLAGLPAEVAIIREVEAFLPGRLRGVYCHPAGAGIYLAVLQFEKHSPADDGAVRQAALAALDAARHLKHVILVDEDVDIFNSNDLLWALTTRYQGDYSTIFLPGMRGHISDPSQSPEFSPLLRAPVTTCKTIFDCTVPFALKERFRRPEFAPVDLSKFPELSLYFNNSARA